MSAAQQLRAVGQALEAWGAGDFTIRADALGEDYLVESNGQRGAFVRRRLTVVDLRRLELAGQSRRRDPRGIPDSSALSTLLRAIGYYVEAQGRRFVAVAKNDLSFVITTMNAAGQLESETQPACVVEDLARFMLLDRPKPHPQDSAGRVPGVLALVAGMSGFLASLYLLMRPEPGMVVADTAWIALLPLAGSGAAVIGALMSYSRRNRGAAVLALAAVMYCLPFAAVLDWKLSAPIMLLAVWPVTMILMATAGVTWRNAKQEDAARQPAAQTPPGAPAAGIPSAGGHSRRRKAGRPLMVLGVLLVAPASALLLYTEYTAWQLSHIVPMAEAAELVWERPAQNLGYGKVPLPVVRITIPSIGLDSPVVQLGTHLEKGQLVWDTASHAVGWYGSTALPGLGSNIVMSGHISSPLRGEGSVFRRLPDVQIGDVIILETAAGPHRYRAATRDVVAPTATEVMAPTEAETLTLITCYPDLIYSHRLVVRAEPT